jgi:hypothetical protein
MVLSIEEMKRDFRAKTKGALIRWLQREGFTFRIGLDGWPVVSRAHADEMLGAKPAQLRGGIPDVKLDHLKGPRRGTQQKEPTRPA